MRTTSSSNNNNNKYSNRSNNNLLKITSQGYAKQKRGPSVVQLSGSLQQHWSSQIDIANTNLKRRKATEVKEKERLEREDELTDDSTLSEESKVKRDERREERKKIREEADRNGENMANQTDRDRLSRISTKRREIFSSNINNNRRKRPQSAIGLRNRGTNNRGVLRPVRSSHQLLPGNRQRPQSALARMRNPHASAPQLDAPDNLFRTLRPNIPADIVDDMKEEHYTQVRELKSKIFQLERERDEANIRVKSIEVKWQDERADKQSLMYNIHLLRKRLQLLTAREIQNQRQLRTFTKLQPLFKTLQEKFNFGSAEEVVQRFQILEDAETEHYHKIASMDDQRRNLEEEIHKISKLRNDEVASLNTEIYQGTEKLERNLAQLERELTTAKSDVKKMEHYRDKYIQLDQMLKQLYLDSCENTGLVKVKKASTAGSKRSNTFMTEGKTAGDAEKKQATESEHPDFNKPEQIVNALRSLYYCSGPTRAGKMLRELIVYVNRMYKHHILRDSGEFYEPGDTYDMETARKSTAGEEIEAKNDNKSQTIEDLRFKPAEILEHISLLIDRKALLEKNLRNRMKRAIVDSKKAQEEKEKAFRALRKNRIDISA